MHSLKSYFKKMDREKLEVLLWEYCEGKQNFAAGSVLDLCAVLAENDDSKPDPWDAFLDLCRSYLTNNDS